MAVVAAAAPGEFDVAPDGDARLGGSQEERFVRLPAGGGDDEFRGRRQGGAVAEAHGDTERLQFGRLRAGAFVVAVVATVRSAPRSCRARAAGMPLTPSPATVTCLPCQSPVRHLSAAHPA
ncbi:hypothetical protein SCALM49S_06276 [Streptomyces californicus]